MPKSPRGNDAPSTTRHLRSLWLRPVGNFTRQRLPDHARKPSRLQQFSHNVPFRVWRSLCPKLFAECAGICVLLGGVFSGEQVFPPDDCLARRTDSLHDVDEPRSAVCCLTHARIGGGR